MLPCPLSVRQSGRNLADHLDDDLTYKLTALGEMMRAAGLAPRRLRLQFTKPIGDDEFLQDARTLTRRCHAEQAPQRVNVITQGHKILRLPVAALSLSRRRR